LKIPALTVILDKLFTGNYAVSCREISGFKNPMQIGDTGF